MKILLFALVLSLGSVAPASTGDAGRLPGSYLDRKPKLVLVLVIDQFRADYLSRYRDKFLPPGAGRTVGGFRHLTDRGAWFPQAEFDYMQNMTGPGHATILSGAYPYATGIPLNTWFDRERRKPVYCVEDDKYTWLSGTKEPGLGTSPKHFNGSTLGDELKGVQAGSRVVSIALKDRAAILMGGRRADATLWIDPVRFQWTSTGFYFPEGTLPDWVKAENGSLEKRRDEVVPLSFGIGTGGAARVAGTGAFPAGLRWRDKGTLGTPAGLALTESLVESAITAMKLGQREATDLLAVSFSSHDYAGHTYGPDGAAMEQMTIADDAVLAKLFRFLEARVPGGLKNVLVVLTADHGVAANPELLRTGRMDAGRVDEAELEKRLEKRLTEKFDAVDGGWVLKVNEMNVYLSRAALAAKGNRKAVEDEVKTVLLETGAVAHVVTSEDYEAGRLPPGHFGRQFAHQFVPGRSGDVVAMLKPFYISVDETASHQTGYSYDRTVPLILAGPWIRPGAYATKAEIVDIAPTLAFLIGILPPSQSHGRVLAEALATGP